MLQIYDDHFKIKNKFKNIQKQMTEKINEILLRNMTENNDSSNENSCINNDENVDLIDEKMNNEIIMKNVNHELKLFQIQIQYCKELAELSS